MDCGNIGSGLQAVGAAIEPWALLGIVWRPWLRPKLIAARARLGGLWRRWWPWAKPKQHVRSVGDVAEVDEALTLRWHKKGPDDDPSASPEERIELAFRRIETLEERIREVDERRAKEVQERFDEAMREARSAREELSEKVAAKETEDIRIRTRDGLRFLVGVTIALAGATVSTFC